MKKFNYIYLITNTLNNKIYIGKHSTDNLDDGYMGSGILICKAEKKYGLENFTKEYLAFCDTEEKLNWFEKFYIKKFNARQVGYNLTNGGDGGRTPGSWEKGHIDSFETRKKKSISHTGKKRKPMKEETRTKISNTKSGTKVPKLSESLKGRTSPFKGCQHTEETKQKLRKPKTEEHKQKLSEAQKRYCKEHSNQNAGKHYVLGPMTEEHKQKLRDSNKHPHKKAKWLASNGEIVIMDKSNARRYHPDWKEIGEV